MCFNIVRHILLKRTAGVVKLHLLFLLFVYLQNNCDKFSSLVDLLKIIAPDAGDLCSLKLQYAMLFTGDINKLKQERFAIVQNHRYSVNIF